MKKSTIFKVLFTSFIVTLIFFAYKSATKSSIYKINIIKKESNNLIDDINFSQRKDYWSIIEQNNNTNHELQQYSLNNATFNDQAIEIVAKKEDVGKSHYTSGFITTKDKFAFLYGKIIFKAKAALGKGLLSAVWLLPEDGSSLPEVDVVEILGENPNQVWTVSHFLNNGKADRHYATIDIPNNDYSLYELDWKENELDWYINNKLVYTVTDNVPDKRMYLNINLAVGGDWPGRPSENIFPASFNIDYIIVIPEKESK